MRSSLVRLVVLVALTGCAGGASVAADDAIPDRLTVAIEGAYPPFSDRNASGKLIGFDVDIARAVCAEIETQCEFVQEDWATIQSTVIGETPEVWGKDFDVIVASVSITETRRKTAGFTGKYYQVPAYFVGAKDGVERTTADFDGHRIGVQASTTHDAYATSAYGGRADLVRYPTVPAALDALKSGEVELVLADAMVIEQTFLKTADGKGYEFKGPPLAPPRYFGQGVGIVVAKENEALRRRLDQAIAAIRADGTYQDISERYFGFDIYGG